MLHLLLIILLVAVIWKVAASPSGSHPRAAAAIQTGLGRVQIVLAVLGGLLGGLTGYAATSGSDRAENPGAILLGALIGFALIWGAMAVLIWIVGGFLGRE
jgi:hypothetical protein